jgi:hypothetical protein
VGGRNLKMKAKRLLGAILAGGLGLVAITSAGDALAQGRGKKEAQAAPPAVAAQPPMTKKPIVLQPAELKWGMTHKQVAEVIDKVLDEDYKPRFKKVSPGVNMRSLEGELAEEKSIFRRSRIDFGKLPTGVDASPRKGEYTYLNKESMMSLNRNGRMRFFFFIQDKLWKVIDEYQLAEGGPLGKDWVEAVTKLAAKVYGVPGRILEADYAIGRNATEVDWKDATMHVRAIQRGDTAIALAYEDISTWSNLSNLRPNKPAVVAEIDPAVAAAVKGGGGGSEPPPPPPAPNKKK